MGGKEIGDGRRIGRLRFGVYASARWGELGFQL